jgi:SAM-dependent MidA family methyltransferase
MHDLRELIADRIGTSGPISFAEFMELSLYHPELGYYARAARKTGRAGDFFTSVDVGPIFGEMLARQLAEMWRILASAKSGERAEAFGEGGPNPQSLSFDLVEAGAGDGRLSRDILDAAQHADPDFYSAIRLSLVERSAAARAAQPGTLGTHATILEYSAAAVPERITGVILANELLDALPNHSVVMSENGLREVFVDVHKGAFVERLEDPSTPRLAEYLSRAGAVMPVGARAEVNLAAEDWIKSTSRSLAKGFMVIIDYGHHEAELYGGSHATGTLASFKQHTQLSDCLQAPGECDITAHVDLTAVTRAAERSGLTVLGLLDQTYFILGLGIGDLESMSLHQRLAMKTLLLPGGLGSTHKVLIFGKDVGTPPLKSLSYRVRLT